MDVWDYGLEKYKLLIFNENEQEIPQCIILMGHPIRGEIR